MAKLYNLARMSTSTTGAGTITLGAAVSGFLSFATAGVTDGQVISYAIEDGSNRETGTGTYTASGTTLSRTVTKSTNSDAAINLSGAAQVFITPRKEDIQSASETQSANTIWAGPTSGGAAAPTFRAPALADLAAAFVVSTTTPTVTAAGGAFTTISASVRYIQVGKIVLFGAEIDITTAGSATGALILPLPVAANTNIIYTGSGNEWFSTGFAVSGVSANGGTQLNITKYDATTIIASGRKISLSGYYEAA